MPGSPADDDAALVRRRLQGLREEITQLIELGSDAADAVELDQQKIGRLSRMDAMQQQAMAQDAMRRRRNELVRIDEALERLEAGEYGACIACGEDIAPGRLDLDPAASHCVRCAGG